MWQDDALVAAFLPRANMRAAYEMGGYTVFVCWTFLTGIVLKLPLVRSISRWSWLRSTLMDLALNSTSLVVRTAVIPLAVILWTVFSELTPAVSETDAPGWISVSLSAVLAGFGAELWLLRRLLTRDLSRVELLSLCSVNAASVLVGLLAVYRHAITQAVLAFALLSTK